MPSFLFVGPNLWELKLFFSLMDEISLNIRGEEVFPSSEISIKIAIWTIWKNPPNLDFRNEERSGSKTVKSTDLWTSSESFRKNKRSSKRWLLKGVLHVEPKR